MNQVTPEVMEELKLIFQTREECNTSMKKQDDRITDIKIEMAGINTKLKIVIAILGAIASGVPNLLPAIVKILANS